MNVTDFRWRQAPYRNSYELIYKPTGVSANVEWSDHKLKITRYRDGEHFYFHSERNPVKALRHAMNYLARLTPRTIPDLMRDLGIAELTEE